MTDYAYRELELKWQLAEVLAEHDGKSLDHAGTRYSYEHRADELVTAWKRNPSEPATDIDRLCQAVLENEQMPRGELADAAVHREGRGNEPEREILVESREIHLAQRRIAG